MWRELVKETLAADVGGANRLKFTPDGKLALISSLRSADVTVIDTATRKIVKRIAVGHGAAGIQMQPDGARAWWRVLLMVMSRSSTFIRWKWPGASRPAAIPMGSPGRRGIDGEECHWH
jgi:YVTN family beta-propeller protein